jgi:hypothetical protein
MELADVINALQNHNKVVGAINNTKYVQGYTTESVLSKPTAIPPQPPAYHEVNEIHEINELKYSNSIKLTKIDEPIIQGYTTDGDFITFNYPNNTFISACLHLIDSTLSVLPLNSIKKTVDDFKIDLAKNLDNDKQLYKKFGFSRKRSITIDGMKAFLTGDNTDTNFMVEVFTYMAKLLQKNICIVDFAEKSRGDYMHDVLSPWILFRIDTGSYQLYTGTENIYTVIEKELKLTPDIKLLKANELKKIIKLTGLSKEVLFEKVSRSQSVAE